MYFHTARLSILAAVLAVFASSSNSATTSNPEQATGEFELVTYQLTTAFQGVAHPLTASESGVMLADSAEPDVSTQWSLTAHGDGLFRIMNASKGDKSSLTVDGTAADHTIQMSESVDDNSQLWRVQPLDNGFCRLTSQLLGTELSLDIINEATPRQVFMAASGNFSGQNWKLTTDSTQEQDPTLARCTDTKPDRTLAATTPDFTPTADYRAIDIRDFRVLVNPELDVNSALYDVTLNVLDSQLSDMEKALPPTALKSLQQVPVWVELHSLTNSAAQFHPSEDWLRQNGYNPEKAGGVEISNASNFVVWSRSDQPSIILHEMAHAWQFRFSDNSIDFSDPYEEAVASGIYESVDHIDGTAQSAYALTDDKEYFAEVTEAYYGVNDFYPFNRDQLRAFDPAGYSLVEKAWGEGAQ